MNAKVTNSFLHANTGRLWREGETFRGDAATVRQLVRQGYLQGATVADVRPREDEAAAPELAALTVAELRALCGEAGKDVPKRARKADLIALLEG